MQQNLTRREALKRGAMTVGALTWATPAMQVVGISPAYAQEPSAGEKNCCIDADGKTVKLTVLRMKYLGFDQFCDTSSFTQDDSLVSCTDFPDGPLLPNPAYIIASNQESIFKGNGALKDSAKIWFQGSVSEGSDFDLDTTLEPLDTVLKGETWVHIFDFEPVPGDSLPYRQKVGFHTSCSEPLFTGDQFGSVRVVDCEHEEPEAELVEPAAEIQELEETEQLEEGAELQEGEETGEGQETEQLEEGEETEPVEGSEEGDESEKPEKPEQSQGNGPPGSNESSDDPVTTTSTAESDGSTDSTDESGTEETSG